MNLQSSLFKEEPPEVIQQIFSASLGETVIWEAHLLKGGMFNTTYQVTYGSKQKKVVLRLGPINCHLLMGFEKNLMAAEVYVCQRCKEQGIPCSTVLACDTSGKLVDRDYMIVEYIPSIVMCDAGLSRSEKDRLNVKIGEYTHLLHQVQGKCFGYVSRILSGTCFDRWSSALIYEVEDILGHLQEIDAFSSNEANCIRSLYEQNQTLLDEIVTPHLLHTDLWEGNVLLDEKGEKIAAVIDGDRAVFGDIDFEFASPWMDNPALEQGYGPEMISKGSENREKRKKLYLLYYMLIETYVGIGEYNNLDQFKQGKQKVLEIAEKF